MTKITWQKHDNEAKQNSSPTFSDPTSWSNLEALKAREQPLRNLVTGCELNTNLLGDDTVSLFTKADLKAADLGVWSNSVSGADGVFTEKVSLEVSFNRVVDSTGITLVYWPPTGEFCREVTITWYDDSGGILSTKDFVCDAVTYFCRNTVNNYKKVKVQFKRTNLPYTHLKLSNIYYGEVQTLTDKDITEVRLLEEVSLFSEKLSYNSLTFTIVSTSDEFNIIENPETFESLRDKKQKFDVYENDYFYGSFYLSSLKAESTNELKVTAYSLPYLLSATEFVGGVYSKVKFSDILNEIKALVNFTPIFEGLHDGFEVDQEVLDTVVSGYIPVTKCREALHIACFAAGALVDESRSDKIKIFKKNLAPTTRNKVLPENVVFQTFSPSFSDYYTGVELTAYSYEKGTEPEMVVSGEYAVGTYTVDPGKPHFEYTTSTAGVTIDKTSDNRLTFTVETAGEVEISAKPYIENQQVFSKSITIRDEIERVKSINGNTLVAPDYAQALCDRLFDLYTKRYEIQLSTVERNNRVGEDIEVYKADGIITRLEIDLSGGQTKVKGVAT